MDNAGGSQLTLKGYTVTSSAASAMVISKSLASDGRVYAIDTVTFLDTDLSVSPTENPFTT